jgi:hypothetical protein
MNQTKNYWVFDWLLENQITSLEEAARFLPKYRVLSTLQQRAEQATQIEKSGIANDSGPSIIAGAGVDLSGGGMVCPSPSCMRMQVDKLLRRVWHYFDTVVVNDVLTPLLTDEWNGSKQELIDEILQQFAPLLYLQEIGANDFVEFRPKNPCVEHWEDLARLEGLSALLDSRDQLISSLIGNARFSKRADSADPLYEMECLDAGVTITMIARGMEDQQVKVCLANRLFTEYMVDLVADVSAARECELPLGSAQAFVGRMLRMSRPTSIADVVFQLELPVIDGIPTAELMAIRRDESEYFLNFRNALRRAAQERLDVHPGDPSPSIANEIRLDIIEPELERIRLQLGTAERSLAKKGSAGIFLAALATTCGLLSGAAAPLAISAGVVAALGVVGPAASKHLDDQRQSSLSDMYFLWKAVGHAHAP